MELFEMIATEDHLVAMTDAIAARLAQMAANGQQIDIHFTPDAVWHAINNARLDLIEEKHAVTASALIWRAGRFPAHAEIGPFAFWSMEARAAAA